MKIQWIKHTNHLSEVDEDIKISSFASPRALDDFDINIIDLSSTAIWTITNGSKGYTDSHNDLLSIQKMIQNKSNNTRVLIVFPQNTLYTCRDSYSSKNFKIKDYVELLYNNTICALLPSCLIISDFKPIFEPTETSISERIFPADFHFLTTNGALAYSTKSQKVTFLSLDTNIYFTTLNVTTTKENLLYFIHNAFADEKTEPSPAWISEICFNDDSVQKEIISENEKDIEKAKLNIEKAQDKLKENLRFKSILYTNGNELVTVVFTILEKLFSCDMSQFKDVKKEDFLIKLNQGTFIGEIKGVTSNVKYDNISQLEVHYGNYMDKLQDYGISENVKKVLIINPFRNKPLANREPVNDVQINYAIRNNCLIITTEVLLSLFEKFCKEEISSAECINIFLEKSGLLTLENFS